jgi:hypothetical protein
MLRPMIRNLSIGLATAVATALLAGPALAASTITVCASGCDATTIAGGIAAASDGDTVSIAAGHYREQLDVNKSVSLVGAGEDQTVIEAPDAVEIVNSFTAPGGSENHAIVYADAPNVSISKLTVDGRGQGNGNARFEGIAAYNQSVTISQVHVTGERDAPLDDADSGIGIYVRNDSGTATAQIDSTVDDYQRAGVIAVGTGLTVGINALVHGAGPTTAAAQDGIVVSALGDGSPGPAGSVVGMVDANECDAPACGDDLAHDRQAAGIRLVDVGNLQVSGPVHDNDAGVIGNPGPGATLTVGPGSYLQRYAELEDNRLVNLMVGAGDTRVTEYVVNSGAPVGLAVISRAGDSADAKVRFDIQPQIFATQTGIYANDLDPTDDSKPDVALAFGEVVAATSSIVNAGSDGTISATNVWFGCNAGPGHPGCGSVSGPGIDVDPHLVIDLAPWRFVTTPGQFGDSVSSFRGGTASSFLLDAELDQNSDLSLTEFTSQPFNPHHPPIRPEGPFTFTTDRGAIVGNNLVSNGESGVAHVSLHASNGDTSTATVTFPAPASEPTTTTATTQPPTPTAPQDSSTGGASPQGGNRTAPKISVLKAQLRLYDRHGHLTTLALAVRRMTISADGKRLLHVSLSAHQLALVRRARRATVHATLATHTTLTLVFEVRRG